MLHVGTVEPGTFALLKRLMALSSLQGFSLVGGTALSLRHGHRRSVDLDLFRHGPFDREDIVRELARSFGTAFTYRRDNAKWAAFCTIEGVKVDIIKDPHPVLLEPQVVDGVRLYRDEDIGPMKIEAILLRARKKDFWDLAELLEVHGLPWLLEHHQAKYPDNSIAISIPYAITWFVDAEHDAEPIGLKGRTWESVKQDIGRHVNMLTR